MFQRLQKRSAEEEGFTLIELMVVVLIIGILIAIALPTFLGARERAQNKAAQSSLRNALVAAKVIFTDNDAFGDGLGTPVTAVQLNAVEPALTFQAAASTTPVNISFLTADVGAVFDQQWGGASLAATNSCWLITDYESGASAGTFYDEQTPATACTGAAALTSNQTSW